MAIEEGEKPKLNAEILAQTDEDIWRGYLGQVDPSEKSTNASPRSRLVPITGISPSGTDLLERKGGKRLPVEDGIELRFELGKWKHYG